MWFTLQVIIALVNAMSVSYPLSFVPGRSLSAPEAYRSILARHQPPSYNNNTKTQELRPYTWDSQFLIQVQVGTPPQLLDLVLDTGSSDLYVCYVMLCYAIFVQIFLFFPPPFFFLSLSFCPLTGFTRWVFSPQVPEWQQQEHNQYNPNVSSTARPLPNATWAVHYGDGSTSNGDVVIDIVTIAGIASQSQAVETAKNVSIEFYGNPRADGIIGFGFSQRNKGDEKSRSRVYFLKGELLQLTKSDFGGSETGRAENLV